MSDKELKLVAAFYGKIRDNLSHAQVSTLTSMLVPLGKEWEARERIETYNQEFSVQNAKCSWKPDYKPIPMLPVPEIKSAVVVQKTTATPNTSERKEREA